MRHGPALILITLLFGLILSSPALADDSLNVVVDNSQIALGDTTTIAAHVVTDASFGGGHINFKYEQASQQCAATAAADPGTDATGSQPIPVSPGPGTADVGGQMVQLDAGIWRICGWLVDDQSGATVAVGSTTVTVLPYAGSVTISVQTLKQAVQVVLSYTTSSPARLTAWVQRAQRRCATSAHRIPSNAILLLPRAGRLVGTAGGLGRQINTNQLSPGRWRVCSLLTADVGKAGPSTKAFVVRRQQHLRRHAVRVAG